MEIQNDTAEFPWTEFDSYADFLEIKAFLTHLRVSKCWFACLVKVSLHTSKAGTWKGPRLFMGPKERYVIAYVRKK